MINGEAGGGQAAHASDAPNCDLGRPWMCRPSGQASPSSQAKDQGNQPGWPERACAPSAAATWPAAPAGSWWKCAARVPGWSRSLPYHDTLLASAAFGGTSLITGGTDPARKNVTHPLAGSLSGGTGLARLDTGRPRATWLAAPEDIIDRSRVAPWIEMLLPWACGAANCRCAPC